MVAHPARRRIHGMVVVHLARGNGEAFPCGVAHVVVEDEDTVGAQFVAQQALDFRVVDPLDLVGRIKICDLGRRLDQAKPLRSSVNSASRPRASSIVTSRGSSMPFQRGTPGGGSMRYEAGFSVPRFR